MPPQAKVKATNDSSWSLLRVRGTSSRDSWFMQSILVAGCQGATGDGDPTGCKAPAIYRSIAVSDRDEPAMATAA
jgi:hypothetical protein